MPSTYTTDTMFSAEGGGIEPYPTPLPGRLVSNQVPEPVRLPSVCKWTDRESNPDFRHARAVSSRWTISPIVERRGIEPRLPGCKPSVFPLDQRPVFLRSSSQGETCTPTPKWARRSERRASANSATWLYVSSPYGSRTRITRMRVSYPEPLEERAVFIDD